MKKIVLILIILSIFIIIFISINNNSPKRENKPVICGDNVCDESEKSYCFDCNLSCKSELCNSKINIICDNCTETQKKLLPILFEHQIMIYNCLSSYYNYNPSRRVYHNISNTNNINEPCTKKEGCYIYGGGIIEGGEIKQAFIPGLREYGESDVTKVENVGFEIHELAHIFTYYDLGVVPSWFTEGISIYTESRSVCNSNYTFLNKIYGFSESYKNLKINSTALYEIAPYDEYYKTRHNSHIIGALYFLALEQDYNCSLKCISEILHSLYEYRKNCTGVCFEEAKQDMTQLMNFSLNNNDLRIPIITNKIIKQKSEETTGKNLNRLFEMLEIGY